MPHCAPDQPQQPGADEQASQAGDGADPRSKEGEDQRDASQRQRNILNN